MNSTPTTLRALADRVCAEEPSAELAWAVKRVMPDDVWVRAFSPLHNLSDAAAMMPAGWSVTIRQTAVEWHVVAATEKPPHRFCRISAPTEPRARTAAALRVRAGDRQICSGQTRPDDAAYIAAANPAAILALIERVRVAEANLAFLDRDYADLKDDSGRQWKALAQWEARYNSLLKSLTHAAALSHPEPILVAKDPTP